MLLKLITLPLFSLVNGIIALVPANSVSVNSNITGMVSMFSTAFQFFPVDVWIAVFGSIMFWVTVHLIYGLVNFIMKLIPFVSMGQ